MKKITLRSKKTGKKYTPHPGQLEVHKCKKRFRVLVCGRRWGKTLLACMELLKFMTQHPGSLCYWLVPRYKQLIPVSDMIREWVPWEIVAKDFRLHKTFRYIELVNGSAVWMHSVEDEDSIRGAGLDFVVLEEAAQMRESVWKSVVRPMLLDSGGKALIISTPKGKNWLYEEYLKGQSPDWPDYKSWQRSTYENPYIPKELIEEERKSLPSDIFRQEFLAEFVEGGGTVFRGVRECFRGDVPEHIFNVVKYSEGLRIVPKEPITDRTVYIGVDLARHEAFTVFVALDEDGNLVGFERFRELSFAFQKERLKQFLKYFPRRQILFDARGLGESFLEELRREDIWVEAIKLTNPLKTQLINDLAAKLDERKIRGPAIKELIEELEAFTYHISSSGNVIYEAPANWTDDCVLALAFAASLLRSKATDWISMTGKGYLSRGEGS